MTPYEFKMELQKRIEATWPTYIMLRPLPSEIAGDLYREVTRCGRCGGSGSSSYYSQITCEECNGTGSKI